MRDLAGVSALAWTNLGAYAELYLDVEGLPNDAVNNYLYFQVSENNGGSYLNTNASYGYGGFAQKAPLWPE